MVLHRHYHDVHPIRARAGWIVLRARRIDDDSPCVLVAPGREASTAEARHSLEAVARAHASVKHPLVPAVSALRTIAERPVLELACEAVIDGLELTQRLAQTRLRVPYAAGDAFIMSLREAMQAAHAAGHCLGRISGANVLFAPNGRWSLVGFGENFPVQDQHGRPDPTLPSFVAPEVAAGAPPSPIGDYVALLTYMRSQLAHVDPGGPLGLVLQAALHARGTALTEAMHWIERRLLGELPARRATIGEAIAKAQRIRKLLGVTPDPEAFRALVEDVLAPPSTDRGPGAPEPLASEALTVGADAEWIACGDEPPRPVRGAARRIVLALVEHHLLGATTALRSVDLIELGWPSENPEYEAGLNRVYVTMNRLKKLLPEGSLQRFDDGYRLAPGLLVQRAS